MVCRAAVSRGAPDAEFRIYLAGRAEPLQAIPPNLLQFTIALGCCSTYGGIRCAGSALRELNDFVRHGNLAASGRGGE